MNLTDSALQSLLDRRSVLKGGLTLSLSAMISVGMAKPALALPSGGVYSVSLVNSRTHEKFDGVYRVGNRYLPEAFERINFVMRDVRAEEIFPMDPRAIDIIAFVHKALGTREAYSVISGYRSPHTNSELREKGGGGVAKRSLHMSGQAVDVRLSETNVRYIRDMGKRLKAGGVGYYPRSNFVHLDSGDFRTW